MLTPHVLIPNSGSIQLVRAGCRLIKSVNNNGVLSEARGINSTIDTVIRYDDPRVTAEQLREQFPNDPVGAAHSWLNTYRFKFNANPDDTTVETPNEPVFKNGDVDDLIGLKWLNDFLIALSDLLHGIGLRMVGPNFSTGYPAIESWNTLLPLLHKMKANGDILSIHGYSVIPPGDDNDNTNRLEQIFDRVLAPNGLQDMFMMYGEWGEIEYKKDLFDNNHNLIRGALSDDEYAARLIAGDARLMAFKRKARNFLGATIFTFGSDNVAWDDYNVGNDGNKVPPKLSDRIRNTPEDSTQPVVMAQGIDVSHHQGAIDWERVKAAGIQFAFIRVSDGLSRDTRFDFNWSEAKAKGILRGVYQFFRPNIDPVAQANLLVTDVASFERGDIPPVLDVEVFDGATDQQMIDRITKWIEVIKTKLGVEPLIYTSAGFWNQIAPTFKPVKDLWIANWTTRPTPTLPHAWSDYRFWQYTSSGRVDGISTNVDRNRFNGTLEQLRAYIDSIPVIVPPEDRPPQMWQIDQRVKVGSRNGSTALNVRSQPVGGVIGNPLFALSVGVEVTVKSLPFYALLNGNKIAWVRIRTDDGREGYVSQTYLDPLPVIEQPIELLFNPSFELGHYFWHDVPELAIPNGYDFWYQGDVSLRLDRQDDPFFPPECVNWNRNQAPEHEKNVLFLDDQFNEKVFKGWGPIWFRISQVVNLTPGKRYRFTAPVFPDLVMRYENGEKVWADDPLAGEIRLTLDDVDIPWMNGNDFRFGEYTSHTMTFTATDDLHEVAVECRGRWGLIENGFFFDKFSLEEVQ